MAATGNENAIDRFCLWAANSALPAAEALDALRILITDAGVAAKLSHLTDLFDYLRARADAGDWHAAGRLADLLAERGDLDQAGQILRARADAGRGDADRLAELLIRQGRGKEAERLRRFGLDPDGSIARG